MALPNILYWEDPVQSGAVFGTVLVTLVSLCYYSLITVASYTCLTLLMVVLAVKLYSYVMVMLKKADLGSWFNFLTLIILGWLGLFTLPKLYLNNQDQVD